MPRVKAEVAAERQRAKRKLEVLQRVEDRALDGAEAAIDCLVLAVSPPTTGDDGKPIKGLNPTPQQISAATYILNQVIGRAGEREVLDPTKDQVRSLLEQIWDLRKHQESEPDWQEEPDELPFDEG